MTESDTQMTDVDVFPARIEFRRVTLTGSNCCGGIQRLLIDAASLHQGLSDDRARQWAEHELVSLEQQRCADD